MKDCVKLYKSIKSLPNLVEILLNIAKSFPENKQNHEPLFRSTFIQPLLVWLALK